MERPKISINGVDLSDRQAHEVVEVLFLCIRFTYSPMDTIRENLKELFSVSTEYLSERKSWSKDKKDRASCGRLMRLINTWNIKWMRLPREELIGAYWDFVLRGQNLALLPGFGVATNFGDVLMVNPEKRSLRSIENT